MFKYNFDEHANDVVNEAFAKARDFGHQYVGTEHLILGLSKLDHESIRKTFEYYEIKPLDIEEEIIKRVGKGDPLNGISDYTPKAKACLERSLNYANQMGSQEILVEHLFLSILQDKYCDGYKILVALSLDINKIIGSLQTDSEEKLEMPSIIKFNQVGNYKIDTLFLDETYDNAVNTSILEKFGINLTEKAKDDVNFTISGRDKEINQLIQILTRMTKNNPIVVGDPGVGKTATVYGLARRIAQRQVPFNLIDKQIISLNVGALISGTMYRGQFEERMNEIIEVLLSNPEYILFIDEIQTMVGAGSTNEKSLDAMAMLKPYLSQGEIQIIGTTSFQDFDQYIAKDAALSRRFIQVTIDEPDDEQTFEMMKQIKSSIERHHDVIITDIAIESAIKLSQRYLPNRKLPDKAIDVIDEACAYKRILNFKTVEIIDELKYHLGQIKTQKEQAIMDNNFEIAGRLQAEERRILNHIEKNESARKIMQNQKYVIEKADIEHIISEWTHIPIQKVTSDEKETLSNLESELSLRLIGQTQAVMTVAKALKRSRLGIKSAGKPVGTFLFIGPTGVGKTELAKTIADVFYGDESELIRFDMSEFMERHSVSKMIGSPPGYEGNNEGGLLTNEVSHHPYAVVVFDEIEKAHPEVVNILLQMMDEGHLTDGRGKKVNFKNTLIIMTSNLGADTLRQSRMGFFENQETVFMEEKLRKAAKAYFKPEFINRMDEMVVFQPLVLEDLEKIAQNQLEELKILLAEQDIEILIGTEVAKFIAVMSKDDAYGARPIQRFIDRHIKDLIADAILGANSPENRFRVLVKEEKIEIEEII